MRGIASRLKKAIGVYSLLGSYLIIISIFMVVFMIIFSSHAQKNYENEMVSQSYSRLLRLRDDMDALVSDCKMITKSIQESALLSTYRIQSNQYSQYEGRLELAKLKASNNTILALGLRFENENWLHSSSGASRLSTIAKKLYLMDKYDEITLLNILDDFETSQAFYAESAKTLFYTHPVSEYSCDRLAVFVFSKYALDRMFKDTDSTVSSIQLMISPDADLLYLSENTLPFLVEDCQSILESDPTKHGEQYRINGESYLASVVVSSQTGWYFISLLPKADFSPIVKLEHYIITYIVSLLVFSVLLALLFTYINWSSPVANLGKMLGSHSAELQSFSKIQNAVERVVMHNERLSRYIDEHDRILRENILLRLLKVNTESGDSFSRTMDALGMPNEKRCCVINCAVRCDDAALSGRTMNNLIDFVATGHQNTYAVEYGKTGNIIIIMMDLDENAAEQIQVFLNDFKDQIGTDASSYCIGVGSIVATSREMKQSYMQALAVCEATEGIPEGSSCVKYFEKPAEDKLQLMPYAREDEIYMKTALRDGNLEMSEHWLRRLLENTMKTSPSMLSYVQFRIIDIILATAAGIGESKTFEASLESLIHTIDQTQVAGFLDAVLVPIASICGKIKQLQKDSEEDFVQKVLDFTRENYADEFFSLDSLTNRFGFSCFYWSRFFKDSIGTNFSNFVWELRFKKSKELLAESDISIKEIVTAVGYLDVSSFNRKFKLFAGVTPGQYRKLYGINQPHDYTDAH